MFRIESLSTNTMFVVPTALLTTAAAEIAPTIINELTSTSFTVTLEEVCAAVDNLVDKRAFYFASRCYAIRDHKVNITYSEAMRGHSSHM